MSDPRRRLRLLVPVADRTIAAVAGRLPSLDVTLVDGETTVAAVWRGLPSIGLSGPALACVVDQRPGHELGDGVREALVVLDTPLDGWTAPGDWARVPVTRVDLDLPGPLAVAATIRLEELAGRRDVPPERASWSRPGWHREAVDWIERALGAAERPPATGVVQIRQWGISTVLRVDTPGGRCWFKAAFPPFRQEATTTGWLDRFAPGWVPHVIAAEHDRGWLLLDDLGPVTPIDDAAATRLAVDRLVTLQHRAGPRERELREIGVPDRRPESLPSDLREALASTVARDVLADPDGDAVALVDEIAAVLERRDRLPPDGLVHGDLHPGNVAIGDGGAVLFDWSDAAIACPIVDIPTWTWWFPDDDDRVEHVWACFEAAWSRAHGIAPGTVDRRDATLLAAAHHTVSYVRILDALEPWARHEHAEGVSHFHELMRRSLAGG